MALLFRFLAACLNSTRIFHASSSCQRAPRKQPVTWFPFVALSGGSAAGRQWFPVASDTSKATGSHSAVSLPFSRTRNTHCVLRCAPSAANLSKVISSPALVTVKGVGCAVHLGWGPGHGLGILNSA